MDNFKILSNMNKLTGQIKEFKSFVASTERRKEKMINQIIDDSGLSRKEIQDIIFNDEKLIEMQDTVINNW